MKLKEQLLALLKAMQTIVDTAKAEDRDLTEAEAADIEAKAGEAKALRARIEAVAKSEAMLAELVEHGKSEDTAEPDAVGEMAKVAFSERYIKSAAYEAFRKANPSGIGSGSPVSIEKTRIGSLKEYDAFRKADLVTTEVGLIQPIRYPTIDLIDRPPLTLLDLVSRGQTGGNFEYVQIVAVERGAAIVPEATSSDDDAALKPLSSLQTKLADAKVVTYADGYEVTNQLLADAPAFATFLTNELRYSLSSVIEDKLLNGSGTDGEPTGLLNTTGVQHQGIDSSDPMDVVKAARRAITKVTRLAGGVVTAILLSPEDDEAIDLMQDDVRRFFGQGPFGTGPQTLWGRARVTSERLEPGQFILGDFRQIALLDREGLSVLAFNQHKDFAQRNLTYVRAELRAAQVIWRPSRLVIGEVGTSTEP